MAVKPKIGVLVMALLEDDYNKTAHMRPAAAAAAPPSWTAAARSSASRAPPNATTGTLTASTTVLIRSRSYPE